MPPVHTACATAWHSCAYNPMRTSSANFSASLTMRSTSSLASVLAPVILMSCFLPVPLSARPAHASPVKTQVQQCRPLKNMLQSCRLPSHCTTDVHVQQMRASIAWTFIFYGRDVRYKITSTLVSERAPRRGALHQQLQPREVYTAKLLLQASVFACVRARLS